MKYRFLIFALLASCCGLGGCIYDDEPECCPSEKVAVEIRIAPENPDYITRSTDENTIRDLNFYLCDRAGGVVLHSYQTAATLRFECLPGDYTLYVVANAHTDMGNASAEMPESYTVPNTSENDDLIMTAVQPITIPAEAGTVLLPALQVRRTVARVDYDITVDESVADIEIRSVQAMNLPVHYRPFVEEFRPSDFLDRELVAAVGDGSAMQGSFYMLPNCQGVRSSITSPEEKNLDNAPDDAACLHIRAVRGGKVLDYYVYLGENDTSDFNVRPNTVHTLHIRILGDDDLRLRQYALDVEMTTRSVPQDGFMLEPLRGELRVRLTGSCDDMQVRGVLTLDEGDTTCCMFDGKHPGVPLQYDLSSGALECTAVYFPETFTRDNTRLKFTLTVSDKYGEIGRYEFEYAFAYVLQVYRVWHNGPRSVFGRIGSEDALGIVEHETLTAIYDAVYCTAEGCTLVAEPNDGYAVDCWCGHPEHQGELSYEPTFHYDPARMQQTDTVYLFFTSTTSGMETTFAMDRTELSAYDRAILDFTVAQPGYDGTYTVKIEGLPTFFRERYMDQRPVTEFTLPGNNSYWLRVRPEAVGENPFVVTVTDENGNSRSFRSSLLGIKTVSYFSLTVGKAPGTGLDIVVECTDPVLSDLTLTVRTNIRITGRTGATVTRTCETAVTLEAGTMKGRETHVLDLSAGDTISILGSEMIFARSTSDNGMVEYRNSN